MVRLENIESIYDDMIIKKNDIIFAIICGLSVAWIASDFFRKYALLFFIVLPILSLIGLWLCGIIAKKIFFVWQAGKFVLAGAFADVIDIRIFQILFLFIPFPLVSKMVSFILATFVKYYSDKHWTFEKHEKDIKNKEMGKFFLVAIVGSLLNVVSFYYFTKIKTGISHNLWIELSIILAAISSGVWNFLGYKFLVFKK